MGQAQINVRTRACSRTSIARTRQAALTHNVRGKELIEAKIQLVHNFEPLHRKQPATMYVFMADNHSYITIGII